MCASEDEGISLLNALNSSQEQALSFASPSGHPSTTKHPLQDQELPGDDCEKNEEPSLEPSVCIGSQDAVGPSSVTSIELQSNLPTATSSNSCATVQYSNDQSVSHVKASDTSFLKNDTGGRSNVTEELFTNLLTHTLDLYRRLGEQPPAELAGGNLTALTNWHQRIDPDSANQTTKNGVDPTVVKIEVNGTACDEEIDAVIQSKQTNSGSSTVTKNSTSVAAPEEFSCRECTERVATVDILRHFDEEHNSECKECILCGKRSATDKKADLQKHMLLHTGLKPHACHYCNATFAQKKGLRQHTQVHLGERRFKCEQCDKGFNRKEHLASHRASVHSDERPFQCNLCGDSFNRHSALKHHLVSHTKDKKYVCEQCHLKVSCRSDLTKHMRVHTGEKPYRCKHCDKRFSWLAPYRNHLRLHEEDDDRP